MIDDRNVTKSSTIIRKSQVYVGCKQCSYTRSIVDSSFGVGHESYHFIWLNPVFQQPMVG